LKKFEPLLIHGLNPELAFLENKLKIAKHILKAIKYACDNQLKFIVVCNILSPSIGGFNILTPLLIPSTNYNHSLESMLVILEEYQEFELCSELVSLQHLLPTIEFKKEPRIIDLKKSITKL